MPASNLARFARAAGRPYQAVSARACSWPWCWQWIRRPLLADEPAASLDIRHRIDVVQALVARARDRLSVVVMHDLDLTFRFFDKVIVMDAGRIVAHGRAQDIFDDERLDAAFGVKFERLTTARDRLLRASIRRSGARLPLAEGSRKAPRFCSGLHAHANRKSVTSIAAALLNVITSCEAPPL